MASQPRGWSVVPTRLPDVLIVEPTAFADDRGWFMETYNEPRFHKGLRELGLPATGQKFIHVAGTNGKGSTCAFMHSILKAAGINAGLFTSPHLIHFGERIRDADVTLGGPAGGSRFVAADEVLVENARLSVRDGEGQRRLIAERLMREFVRQTQP